MLGKKEGLAARAGGHFSIFMLVVLVFEVQLSDFIFNCSY